MSADLDDTDKMLDSDLNQVVPETKLLDSGIQKGRAQLSVKVHKHGPSRSQYSDSMCSMEGDTSLERTDRPSLSACSPLHLTMQDSSPSSDSLLLDRSPAFSFHTPLVRRSPDSGLSLASPRGRYHQLTNDTSQEILLSPGTSLSRPRPSNNSSQVYIRRNRRPESEVLVSESSWDTSPGDPDSPNVVFDQKTKRRFLDLGVTLRRSYIRVRKEKSSRTLAGSRELSESPPRSSGSLVSSWFLEGGGVLSSSRTPPCSPGLSSPKPRKSHPQQESNVSVEFSPPRTSSTHDPLDSSSLPYRTLSDEVLDEPSCPPSMWTTQQVCHWLKGLNMAQYVPEFNARDVDGQELLQMDGKKLKGLGVLSSSDRGVLKRRIKEVQSVVVKERKALDKMEKQKEKEGRGEQEQHRN